MVWHEYRPRTKYIYETRFVYFAHDGHPTRRVKVGMSVEPQHRIRTIRCQMLFAVPCTFDFAPVLEQTIHAELAHLRMPNRRTEGGTEWFHVDDRLATLIRTVRTTRRWPFDGTPVVVS